MTNVLLLFLATNATVFGACLLGRRMRPSLLRRQVFRRVADDLYFAIPLLAAVPVALFSNYDLARWSTLLGVAACGLPALVRRKSRWSAGTRAKLLLDASAVALIVGVAFNANYDFDVGHYAFFLGPTASLLGGRRPLVDINCQYGVGVIYFLASMFKLHLAPLSYQGMSAVLSVLGILHFTILYVLLRMCLRSQGHCLLALVVMLAVRVLSHPAYLVYPSLGPLRFIWGHVLLLFIALRERLPGRSAMFRKIELAFVGVMSVWSVESFAAVVVTFLGLVFYEAAFGDQGRPWRRIRDGVKRVAGALLAIAIVHALLAAEIRSRTGQWPDWSQYTAYVLLYAKADSFWGLPIATWEPWAPIALIYLVSLTTLSARGLFFRRRHLGVEHKILWGMTILGIVEFSHYIGRSHVDHLRIYMCEIFIAAYWMDRAARESPAIPSAFRKSFLFAAYASAGLLLFSAVPGFASGFRATALGHVATDQAIVSPSSIDQDAPWRSQGPLATLRQEAIRLINKYQPGPCNVALFRGPKRCTVALLMEQRIRPTVLLQVGKANVWPISVTDQDAFEPGAKARILAYSDGLAYGDIIYLSDDLPALEQELVAGLKKRFRFSEIEASPSGIKAVRLDPLVS